MANLDLSVLPAKVTIEFIAKDSKVDPSIIASDFRIIKHESGSTLPGAQEAQEAEKDSAVAMSLGHSSEIQMFGINLFKKMEVGDVLVLKVETSKELFYWNLLKEKFPESFKVTIEDFE